MAKLHAGLGYHATCFFAIEQTHGRGQRGRKWLSNAGDNITMSSVFALQDRVSANVTAFPFLVSASMALGCYDFIKDCGIPDVSIKWPNDVYSGDRKAAGILIDNIYKGTTWEWTVVGTGINVNQAGFSPEAGNAVSFKMLTNTTYNATHLGKLLSGYLIFRFKKLQDASISAIMDEYNTRLYRKDEYVKFRKNNITFSCVVKHVTAYGELVTDREESFKVGEVEFV
jgi:BirA family transcriptional regulator, biotin operon repressor / biotin---[acetyl-CoA-carboxylase] ligase